MVEFEFQLKFPYLIFIHLVPCPLLSNPRMHLVGGFSYVHVVYRNTEILEIQKFLKKINIPDNFHRLEERFAQSNNRRFCEN